MPAPCLSGSSPSIRRSREGWVRVPGAVRAAALVPVGRSGVSRRWWREKVSLSRWRREKMSLSRWRREKMSDGGSLGSRHQGVSPATNATTPAGEQFLPPPTSAAGTFSGHNRNNPRHLTVSPAASVATSHEPATRNQPAAAHQPPTSQPPASRPRASRAAHHEPPKPPTTAPPTTRAGAVPRLPHPAAPRPDAGRGGISTPTPPHDSASGRGCA
jgi:hypothetical protein